MAECIISRAAGQIPDEILNPIYPTAGVYKLLITLRFEDNTPIKNTLVSCKDGSTYYNYTTNEKGQCLFSCNSGAANIFVNNTNLDGKKYVDIIPTWMNIDCPVGETGRFDFKHNKNTSKVYEFYSSEDIYFSMNHYFNAFIVGGGGGGAGAFYNNSYAVGHGSGTPGAAGYMNNYYNQFFQKYTCYKFIAGSGGSGGRGTILSGINYNAGGTGGTSTLSILNLSAVGGEGGRLEGQGIAIGGLGNGGAQNSPVSFAGGGGGGYYSTYGRPGGGAPINYNASNEWIGPSRFASKGGGGGTLQTATNLIRYGATSSHYTGGIGGKGMLRLEEFI